MAVPIHGHCDPAFEGVRKAFEQNFSDFNQVGARVAVLQGDETVVDLWGGHKTEAGD